MAGRQNGEWFALTADDVQAFKRRKFQWGAEANMHGELCLTNAELHFVRILIECEVRFVVIGGHAVCFYGHDRPIGDLDIVIEPSKVNAQRFKVAGEKLGIPVTDLTLKSLARTKREEIFPLWGVHLLTSVDRVSFASLFRQREPVSHEGTQVPLCSQAHILGMKCASERPRDREDCIALKALAEQRAGAKFAGP